MKKITKLLTAVLLSYSLFLIPCSLRAQSSPAVTMFSTSADWEAVTGLRMSQYRVVFGRDRTVSSIGWELYFLDAFPCFGQAEAARVWISPATNYAVDRDARMRIVCVYAPATINLAYREVRRDAVQGATRGLAVCPVETSGRDLTVNLTECEKTEWKDLGR